MVACSRMVSVEMKEIVWNQEVNSKRTLGWVRCWGVRVKRPS